MYYRDMCQYLGVGVDDARDGVVVDVAPLASQVFGRRDALLLRLVGQHGARHAVSNGVDTIHVGLEVPVDLRKS